MEQDLRSGDQSVAGKVDLEEGSGEWRWVVGIVAFVKVKVKSESGSRGGE